MNGISPALQRLEEQLPNRIDWRYEMRREAQEILPGFFIGPFQPSWSLDTLTRLGITHILCIAETREQHLFKARFPDRFTYLILEMRDADDQNLIRIFPQTQAFIDNAIATGGRVLVHCGDGIGRSPAIATAYVMVKHGLSHEDAFQFVQSRRFCIAPRVEFQHQIETMAQDRFAQQSGPPRAKRRERDDDDDDDEDEDEGGMGGSGLVAGTDRMMDADMDLQQRVPMPPQWGMT